MECRTFRIPILIVKITGQNGKVKYEASSCTYGPCDYSTNPDDAHKSLVHILRNLQFDRLLQEENDVWIDDVIRDLRRFYRISLVEEVLPRQTVTIQYKL